MFKTTLCITYIAYFKTVYQYYAGLCTGPKVCLCGQVAKYECFNCVKKVGGKAIVFCDNCRSVANQIHFQLDHEIELVNVEQSGATLDLVALICKRGDQYFSFVKCSTERMGPWLYYDTMEPGKSKVTTYRFGA